MIRWPAAWGNLNLQILTFDEDKPRCVTLNSRSRLVVRLTFGVSVPHLERHLDASFKCAGDGVLIIRKASPRNVYAYLLTTCQLRDVDEDRVIDSQLLMGGCSAILF